MENLIETLLLRHVHSSFHTSPNVDIPNINRKISIVSVSKSDEMEDETVGQQQTTKSEDETKQMFIKELVNRRKSIDLIDSNSKVTKKNYSPLTFSCNVQFGRLFNTHVVAFDY